MKVGIICAGYKELAPFLPLIENCKITEKSMLKETSNIIHFQNRFEIFNEGEIDFEFIEWVFNTKSKDFTTLTEKTSLQKKLKQHLLSGGVIRNANGRIK